MVIFSALLWHHLKHNTTERIRRAFILTYQEAKVAGRKGKQWKVLREGWHVKHH
jgi:phytanoyl-CoA hydroxylase